MNLEKKKKEKRKMNEMWGKMKMEDGKKTEC